jgi:hypothetical protein
MGWKILEDPPLPELKMVGELWNKKKSPSRILQVQNK